ncbi:D-arabinose 1-dehydrogenase (NAD(P)(+)) ARA1 SCDLUD_001485 [Saccharomycodes ludwigii]|uniref:D-arabinose 1-dehydrogenase (NAD(P)(+)) ARA1 n=1 Tax=Saccharomycodes ludwigii TaxID=36035 RepID=UPI001E8B3270|nr:hypothetical protein SCDLUD_001485 [Saccharomycodes ludwigii]KAH3901712.1 hypothetical protein SCDLUD_001485 [Saccharomycodes ludwigii]
MSKSQSHPSTTEIYFTLKNNVPGLGSQIIPVVGLGTASPSDRAPETKEAVITAIEKGGLRHIDTAWFYGTEKFIGEALQEVFSRGKVKREDLFITTKVWPVYWDNASESIDISLKDLQLDYVDLVLQHWPLCFPKILKPGSNGNGVPQYIGVPHDSETGEPLVESEKDYLTTYKQLQSIVLDPRDHRVKNIGVSNYPIGYLNKLLSDPDIKITPAINQVEINPQCPQLELAEFCHEKGILMTAYSPMGSSGAPILKLPEIVELAKKYNCSGNDIVISYLIRRGIVVIPRSLNLQRIAKDFQNYILLTDEDVDNINQIGIKNPFRHIDEDFAKSIPGFTGRTKTKAT